MSTFTEGLRVSGSHFGPSKRPEQSRGMVPAKKAPEPCKEIQGPMKTSAAFLSQEAANPTDNCRRSRRHPPHHNPDPDDPPR